MQIAPETELLRDYAVDARARSAVFPEIKARSRTYVLLAIVALGLVLRVYAIGAYSFVGDEYNSLVEAQHIGLNWNSIIYSIVLHIWMTLGSSEAWLRLPAALFGVATIPLIFQVGAKLDSWRTGAVAALLTATSPFNIFHSQEVRFYSLFIFAAVAFVWATVHYAESTKSWKSRAALIGSGLLLVSTHFLGVIAVGAQGAVTFLALKRRRPTTAVLITVALPLLIFGLPLLPAARTLLFDLYQRFGNAQGATSAATPVSLLSLAKIGYAGFTFVFGYHVYPLRLFLVVPGALLTGFLIVCGTVRLAQRRKWWTLALAYAIAVCGVYLVLDSLGGRVASGVSPRHVAFAWPVFILVVAMGVSGFHRRTFQLLLFALLALNAVSLTYGWRKDWSYGPATDYRAAAENASRHATPTTAIVFPGRAVGPVDVYFPHTLARIDAASFFLNNDIEPLVSTDRLIFVSDDWEPSRRQGFDRLLRALTAKYTHIEGLVDYPLFEYVLSRDASTTRPRSTDGGAVQLEQPLSIYGLEFQDLKLPVDVAHSGAALHVNGAAELPNADGEKAMTVSAPLTKAKRLVLLTNVINNESLNPGATVAEVTIQNKSKVIATFALRLGIETAGWDQACSASANCTTVFQWHKRMALTGQNSYRGAWRDFQAGMHATTFDLPVNVQADSISVRYIPQSGRLYVWAVALAD